MKVLACIPARGGSKGLPDKNIRLLGGKPLIAWTIEAALRSRTITQVMVSSDAAPILNAARRWGAEIPFVRPPHLATDTASSAAVLLHTLEWYAAHDKTFDAVVLLQPTSPLRTAEDIDACLERMWRNNAPACVSVCSVEHPPFWTYTMDNLDTLVPVIPHAAVRRQDLPATFRLNGATYCARYDFFLQSRSFITPETIAYVMPPERSVDIDTALDLQMAEFLVSVSRHA